jgi:hypothetical protein
MPSLNLSINLGASEPGSAPEPPQFTADWGNINTMDNTATVYWASTTGAQLNKAHATQITFSGLGKTITVTLSISGDSAGVSSVRHEKNGGGIKTTSTVPVTDGDTLIVGVVSPVFAPSNGGGNLIVTNTTDGYVIDTIPYTADIGI